MVSVYERTTVEGKYGIKATLERHSKASTTGTEMLTYVAEYPRIVHAELLTHRMLSKNSASSRAIPFEKMKNQLVGRPVRFGQANPGMQDKGEEHGEWLQLYEWVGYEDGFCYVHRTADDAWECAKESAIEFSEAFYKAGYHKQVYNRLTEPFQMMRTVISGTEWNNFFWLRNHESADPTLQELARAMFEAKEQSKAQVLSPNVWHLPFVEVFVDEWGYPQYGIERTDGLSGYQWLSVEEALRVSAARAAAVSFRNTDYGLGKSLEVYNRLVGDERKHASAFEHQARPLTGAISYIGPNMSFDPPTWEKGVTHVDREGNLWSGNLKGWVQFRKLIPGECMPG